MFGFFKKKQPEPKDDEIPPEVLEEMTIGDRMLEKLGPMDYLETVSSTMLTQAREVPLSHIFGHIHTCIKLGAPSMVSNLAQIAAWRIREEEDSQGAKEHVKEFEQLALQSTMDTVNYLKQNGKNIVYC